MVQNVGLIRDVKTNEIVDVIIPDILNVQHLAECMTYPVRTAIKRGWIAEFVKRCQPSVYTSKDQIEYLNDIWIALKNTVGLQDMTEQFIRKMVGDDGDNVEKNPCQNGFMMQFMNNRHTISNLWVLKKFDKNLVDKVLTLYTIL